MTLKEQIASAADRRWPRYHYSRLLHHEIPCRRRDCSHEHHIDISWEQWCDKAYVAARLAELEALD